MSMALLAYIIRAALVWWLLPAVAYAAWLLWPRRRHARTWLPWMAAVVVARHRVIGPQVYISKQHSDSFNPVSVDHACSRSTFPSASRCSSSRPSRTKGIGAGSPIGRPTSPSRRRRRPADFYLDHPARGAFLVLTHVYAGFHYDQLKPYWQLDRARPLTIWLVAVVRHRLPGRRADGRSLSSPARLERRSRVRDRHAGPVRGVARVRGGRVAVRHRRIRDAVDHRLAEWLGSRPSRARAGVARSRRCSCTSCCPSSTTRC